MKVDVIQWVSCDNTVESRLSGYSVVGNACRELIG